MTSALDLGYLRARAVTTRWAKSFRFASHFLPLDKKRAIFAVYEFCREADNLVDERGTRSADEVRSDLAALDAELERMFEGEPPHNDQWLPLFDTLQHFPIPLEPLRELLVGVAMDLEPLIFPDFPALEIYCQRVAGGVGMMLGPILGVPSGRFDDVGRKLGVAMQLTNILRDVGEDLDRGRLYLPLDELTQFGLTRLDLERREVTPAFRQFMQFQVSRARTLFASGDAVVDIFPRDGSRLTIRLLLRTYAAILDAVEANDFNVFGLRAYTRRRRKLRILARALWDERRSPITGPIAT